MRLQDVPIRAVFTAVDWPMIVVWFKGLPWSSIGEFYAFSSFMALLLGYFGADVAWDKKINDDVTLGDFLIIVLLLYGSVWILALAALMGICWLIGKAGSMILNIRLIRAKKPEVT